MSVDLDNRARAAADGLRRAAGALDVPEWHGEPSRRRPGSRVVWLAAAAAVVLVVIVATLLVRDDKKPVVTTPGEVPVMIPDVVPEGLELTGGVDLPLPQWAEAGESGTLTVFGDPQSPDPFAEADLGVWVWRSTQTATLPELGSETIRGRPAWVGSDGLGRTAVGWNEADGVYVTVSSAALSKEELLGVAEGLRFGDGYETVDASALPARLSTVAALPESQLTSFLLPARVPESTVGHEIGYQSSQHAFLVATISGGPNELLALRWQLGGGTFEPVDVRGHSGYVNAQLSDDLTLGALLWEESPGVLVMMSGDVETEALLAAAESLRRASDDEWAAIKAIESDAIPEEPLGTDTSVGPPVELLTDGIAADGSRWELTLENGELCLHSRDGSDISCVVAVRAAADPPELAPEPPNASHSSWKGGMPATMPPSTTSVVPVTNAASSEHSHNTAAATSSTWPMRCTGRDRAAACWACSPAQAKLSVRMGPGATAFTRTP